MSKVTYTGTSDFQEFSAQDFRKAGIEDQNKVVFARGKSTEVSEGAAQALTSEDGLFGNHSFELSDDEGDEEDANAGQVVGEVANSADLSGSDATTEGTANPPAAGNVGRGSTGRGRSTRGTSS